MVFGRDSSENLSPFLAYLAGHYQDGERIPSLSAISQELGISQAALREQLEVARALGLVEVRPKTGMRKLPYTFTPAVMKSLRYAMAIDEANFQAFAELRNQVEAAFWFQAVDCLTLEDHKALTCLIQRAEEKLKGSPVQIPHSEHRELHLTIYGRLNNPFVSGILESYWELYEAVGLALYTDYSYLQTVWGYHRKMVEMICAGDLKGGYQALVDHADLLHLRTHIGMPVDAASASSMETAPEPGSNQRQSTTTPTESTSRQKFE
jgi:DNA-binding FadR family transcriptional regulator